MNRGNCSQCNRDEGSPICLRDERCPFSPAPKVCANCTAAAQRPHGGFTMGCKGCAARAAARSPQYRQARDSGQQTRQYRALLEQYDVTHAEVKDAAGKDFETKVTA